MHLLLLILALLKSKAMSWAVHISFLFGVSTSDEDHLTSHSDPYQSICNNRKRSTHAFCTLPRPAHWPLVGCALQFDVLNPHKTFLEIAAKYGPVSYLGFGVFKGPIVHVADPRAAVSLLKQDNTISTKGPGYSAIRSVTPHHLLVMEGEEWRRVHKLATSALGSTLRRHAITLTDHARDFADTLGCSGTAHADAAAGAQRTGAFFVQDLGGVVRHWSLGLIGDVVLGKTALQEVTKSSSLAHDGSLRYITGAEAFRKSLHTIMEEWHHRAVDLLPLWRLGGLLATRRSRQLQECLALVTTTIEEALERAVSHVQVRQGSKSMQSAATTTPEVIWPSGSSTADVTMTDTANTQRPVENADGHALVWEVATELLRTLQRADIRTARRNASVGPMPASSPAAGSDERDSNVSSNNPTPVVANVRQTQAFQDGAAVLFSFLAMGHENVSSHISWTLHLLAAHPDKQDTLVSELRAACTGGGSDPIKMEVLDSVKYLDCVLRESLRLFPPVPMLSRESHTDIEVAGFVIPKGMEIVISPYVIHRLPGKDGWDEPEEFRPERFLCGGEGKRGPFMPFGCGPRSCPGAAFGVAEAKAAIAHIVLKHRMSLVGGAAALQQRLFVSLRLSPAMVVEFTRR